MIAATALKGAEALAKKHGIDLNVGEVKQVDDILAAGSPDNSEGPQPIDVASRVVAHLGHRLPLSKRITKKFEGKDSKSGIMSDFAALFAQLAARNEQLIVDKGGEVLSDLPSILKGVSKPPVSSVVTETETVVDFGPTDPEVAVSQSDTQ